MQQEWAACRTTVRGECNLDGAFVAVADCNRKLNGQHEGEALVTKSGR